MKLTPAIAALAIFTLIPCTGAVIHSEATNGDLSGSFLSPTLLTLALGDNQIIAQMGVNSFTGATNGRDADYFTVTLPPGQFLQSLTISSYTFGATNPGASFAAYTAASAFTGQGGGDIDGLSLFNASSGNILDDFTGNTTPLSSGTYAFWFQETSAATVDYQLNLRVVPEPGSALLGAVSIGLWLVTRRRY